MTLRPPDFAVESIVGADVTGRYEPSKWVGRGCGVALRVGTASFVVSSSRSMQSPPWLITALTPFMLGRVVLTIANSPSLATIRARLRLSRADALVGYAVAYAAAGVCLGFAAVIQLEGAVAAVVTLGAASWAGLWGWLATRMWAETNR